MASNDALYEGITRALPPRRLLSLQPPRPCGNSILAHEPSMNAEALLELPKLLRVMLKLLIEMLEMAPMVAYALLQPLGLPFPVG